MKQMFLWPMVEVGDRIRFKRDLDCGPTDEHPAFIYAEKGGYGTITKVGGCREGYWALWDGWKSAAFGCSREEFEVMKNET
ncbi:hypothetical protein LCGC14_1173230 [marine sediment metagenome]|uniref:Uncharacterized protein n=1 Tax=marine sediment metagenome TaxID=412755 RepID=A0A0F9LU45_9ZZZZ